MLDGVLDLPLLREYGWRLVTGLWITAQVVILACLGGFVLSYPIARARMARNAVARTLSLGYITFFRGTPLLCQLYLVYYGAGEIRPWLTSLGMWWFFREAFYCCIFAFTLNTAAYQGEMIRGALLSVPRGQLEAARALGLSRYRVARHVVWPQALLVALRPLGNELISMIKASALAAIVTLLDLMGQTRFIFARTFDFTIYLYAALLYLAATGAIARIWSWGERRLSQHLREPVRAAGAGQREEGALPAPEAITIQAH
ncbi:MAG: ABC transporter permease subunit [Acetobacteraceae bacterium]|nr:ABC transporter permease subunit [Acetobacteraceae bacterium]